MQDKVISSLLRRRQDSHKYDYGHVLVIGGSPGMVGAPLLTGKAALRTGAGLVTVAAPAGVTDKLEKRVEEIMTLSLAAGSAEAFSLIEAHIKKRNISVLLIGPGLAVTPESSKLLANILSAVRLPLIIDGGGLSLLQNKLTSLDSAVSESIILTPHTGEFQQLTTASLPTERTDLKSIASEFVAHHRVILVLKGKPTYVAKAGKKLYENPTGNPGLATAGTGDVLAGVIAGMIAQGIAPHDAAKAGVYLHGLAGDIAATEKTQPGMIASDVIEALPKAYAAAASSNV